MMHIKLLLVNREEKLLLAIKITAAMVAFISSLLYSFLNYKSAIPAVAAAPAKVAVKSVSNFQL